MNRLKNLIRLLSILVVLSGGVIQASAGSTGTSPDQPAAPDGISLSNMRLLGQIGGQMGALAVQGGYAYVGIGPLLVVMDVSDPTNVHRTGSLATGRINDIAISGGRAYLATESGLQVVNLMDPAAPRLVAASESFHAVKVAVQSNYVFLMEQEWSDATPRLRIYSAADPPSMLLVGTYTFFSDPKFWLFMRMSGLQVSGNYAYLTYGGLVYYTTAGSLVVIDVSNPADPQQAGSLSLGAINDLQVVGNTAYLTTWNAPSGYTAGGPASPGSLVVVDLSTPTQPMVSGSYANDCLGMVNFSAFYRRLGVQGSYAYVLGSSDLCVLDVSDPANLALAGQLPTRGNAIVLAGSFAYLGSPQGLSIFSLANPAAPFLAGEYRTPFGTANDVVASSTHAYLASGDGLHILDVSTPSNPFQEGFADIPAQRLALKGDLLFLADQHGLQVVDVSDPAQPKGVSSQSTGAGLLFMDFALAGDHAYLEQDDGLYILDISDPVHPKQTAHLPPVATLPRIAVSGNYLYRGSSSLQVLDISNPANPIEITRYTLNEPANDLAAKGRYLFVAQDDFLTVLDILNPAQPVQLDILALAGIAEAVTLSGDFAYVSTQYAGLQVIDFSDPAHLQEAGNARLPFGRTSVEGDRVYLATGGTGLYILQFAGSQIQGRVATWEGDPTSGVEISTTVGTSLTTGVDGSFLMPHLYSGEYTLIPSSPDYAFYPASCSPSLPPNAVCNFTALSLPVTAAFQPGVSSRLVYTDTQGMPTSLDFPAGALSQPGTLVLTPTLASSGAGLAFTGHAFELSVLDDHGLVLDFAAPVTATISYTDFDIRFVTDESQLILYRWDGIAWVDAAATCTPASAYTRDLTANQISIPICQAGKYALYGPTHTILMPAIKIDSQ